MNKLTTDLKGFRLDIDTSGAVPIVVGVTGHRDLPEEDIQKLRSAVVNQLNSIGAKYPHSPLILLTGLAEGADCLVARCAFELGWSLGAVLALPQAEFEQDFGSDASRAEFKDLLSHCDWIRQAAPEGCPRPKCYEHVGDWIAIHVQYLIALWDGNKNGKIGGTGYVVKLFREGPSLTIPELPDTGPVIHVLTRRQSELSAIDPRVVGEVKVLAPDPFQMGVDGGKELWRWEQVLSKIDAFNKSVGDVNRADSGELQRLRGYLNQGNPLVDAELSPSALRASWLYAVADSLAGKSQQTRNKMFYFMLILATVGLGSEQYYSGPATGTGWSVAIWLLLALACVVAALLPTVWLFLFPGSNPESRYLDCRALAEACRVQYFWKRAGIKDCAASFYLINQRDELEWIRQAVRSTELGALVPEEKPEKDLLKHLVSCWITDQKNFYLGVPVVEATQTRFQRLKKLVWEFLTIFQKPRGADFHRSKGQRLDQLALTFVALASVVIVITICVQVLTTNDDLTKWLEVIYGMLLVLAASSKVYLETQGHKEHARSYSRMGQSMEIAGKMVLEKLNLIDGIQPLAKADEALKDVVELLRKTGISALGENGDWLLLHRDRPARSPV